METAAQSTAALEARITELAGHMNAANYRLLTLIAEFERRKGWAESAVQSCAHWLNWKCGIDMGAAREKVCVARALESLPRISAAMERGELSYSKVRALTRAASAPAEELLLSIALHGTAHHVETTVRCFRRAQQTEELSREGRQQAARRLTWSYDEDGSLIVKATLPAEAGALFVKSLDAAADDCPEQERVSAETSAAAADLTPAEPPIRSAQRADALARIAESFLASTRAAPPFRCSTTARFASPSRAAARSIHVFQPVTPQTAAGRTRMSRGAPGLSWWLTLPQIAPRLHLTRP